MVVPPERGMRKANGGDWRQRARASRPDGGSAAAHGMATAGHWARSLFHARGDPSDVRGDAGRFRDAAGLLLLSQLHGLRAGPGLFSGGYVGLENYQDLLSDPVLYRQHYFADALTRIADHPARRIAELLPWKGQPLNATCAAA